MHSGQPQIHLAGVVLALSACTHMPDPPPALIGASAPAPFGVAIIQPRSDVVQLPAARRHVVFPGDSFPALPQMRATTDASPQATRREPAAALTRSAHVDDEITDRPRKTCIGDPSTSAAEGRVSASGRAPAEPWAEQCATRK